MSHYNKWSGGYFYGSWKKDKDKEKEKEDGKKSSYGDWGYDEDDVDVGYEDAYRSRYKSSIGYSGLGGSLSSWGWGGGYSYYGGYYNYSTKTTFSTTKVTESGFKDLSEIVVKAVREARDLIVILDFPFTVKLQLNNIGYSDLPNNTREIFIPTYYLEDKDKTVEEKIKIFCSLAVNEAAHLKHTEYSVYRSFLKDLKIREGISDKEIVFVDILFNLIEDERVEDALLKERPGYLDFVEKEKLFSYDNFLKAAGSISSDGGLFLINLFRLIRFPKNVDMDVIEEYKTKYENIGTILHPIPDSTKQTCICAKRIYTEVKDIFESEKEFGEFSEQLDYVNLVGKRAMEIISGGFDRGASMTKTDLDDKILSSIKDTRTAEALSGMCDGSVSLGKDRNTFFTKASGEKSQYEYDKRAISRYIPGIRKLIQGYDKNFEFNVYGCRSGLLDTTKLAEAYQGIPQVYVRKGTAVTNKLAVCVLIDESGSMCWHDNMQAARRGAILLTEALKNQPGVELFVYGHSGDILYRGATEINIYKEGNSGNPYSLGSAKERCENRDGTAIYEVANRVRSLTTSHVLMFVISDGYPAARDYGGWPAIEDVRKKVTEVQNKLDTDVIQISINPIEHAKDMFDHFIDISGDVANLAKNLSNIVKKLIIANKQTVITQ